MNENEQNKEEEQPRYDWNILMYMSKTKKNVFFFIFSVVYRFILTYLLLVYVYQEDKSKYNNNSRRILDTNHAAKELELKKNELICTLKGCNECAGTLESNECIACYAGLEPIYDDNTSKTIIECHNPCKTGEGNMCKTCSETKNECETCNIGYYLTSKGECNIKSKNLKPN